MAKVGIICEFSGTVRDAFIVRGHDAVSCDLLPTEKPGPHLWKDCCRIDWNGFDLIIAHPPCTHLAVSGASHFWYKKYAQEDALEFVRWCMRLPIPLICIENPISVISTKICKPNQIVHPWQFGHGECKTTCLWLKNLPSLRYTNVVEGRNQSVHRTPPGPNQWKIRSRTFQGIADAMVKQWGEVADYMLDYGLEKTIEEYNCHRVNPKWFPRFLFD